MFYYLLYNSTFSFLENNRLFSTILYGSIIYIISHAIIHYCNIDFLIIIRNYFWPLFGLDILTFGYCLYNTYLNSDKTSDQIVSFNMLKNKINNIISTNTQNKPIRIIPSSSNNDYNVPKPTIPNDIPQQQFKQSTPISALRNVNNQKQNSLINEKMDLVHPIVTYDENESIAGSDVASVLDLDDFENSL